MLITGKGESKFYFNYILGGGEKEREKNPTMKTQHSRCCATVMTCCILPDPYGGKLTLWQIYEDV